MHDLDPQDQAGHRELPRSAPAALRSGRSKPRRRLALGTAVIEAEELVELSGLGDEDLEREGKREELRDRRQARAIQRASAEMDLRHRALSLGVFALGAVGAAAVVTCGLLEGGDGLVHTGLLAFGAISGTALYQRYLSLKEGWEGRRNKRGAPPT